MSNISHTQGHSNKHAVSRLIFSISKPRHRDLVGLKAPATVSVCQLHWYSPSSAVQPRPGCAQCAQSPAKRISDHCRSLSPTAVHTGHLPPARALVYATERPWAVAPTIRSPALNLTPSSTCCEHLKRQHYSFTPPDSQRRAWPPGSQACWLTETSDPPKPLLTAADQLRPRNAASRPISRGRHHLVSIS